MSSLSLSLTHTHTNTYTSTDAHTIIINVIVIFDFRKDMRRIILNFTSSRFKMLHKIRVIEAV